MKLPTPCSEADKESYESVLSVPWLKKSVINTGSRWGRRIADVKLSRLPQNLLAQVLLTDEESTVDIVIFRWDRYDYQGWKESFLVTLTFPDGDIHEVEVPPSCRLKDGHSFRVSCSAVLRERIQQKQRVIPRIIYNLSAPLNKQLSQEIRRLLKNVRSMTDLVQSTCLYLVIEDEAGRREVQSSGINNFVEAYDSLRSGSFKADLLRYYLLYKYGGVYMDDKTFLRHSLDSESFDYILGDTQMFIGVCRSTEIAFMAARRGSPIMLKALETAITNIMQRFYGNHRLSITGNIMFQKLLQDGINTELQVKSLLGETRSEHWGERVVRLPITLSDERIMYGDDILWQRQAIPRSDWPKPINYYADLWNQYLVYTDNNPDRPFFNPPMSAETKREIIAYTLTFIALICVGALIAQYPPIKWM